MSPAAERIAEIRRELEALGAEQERELADALRQLIETAETVASSAAVRVGVRTEARTIHLEAQRLAGFLAPIMGKAQ